MVLLRKEKDAAAFGLEGEDDFGINLNAEPTVRTHIPFVAETQEAVDTFYAAALAAGSRERSIPALCPDYQSTYYAAFVSDPDGNNIDAACHKLSPG